MDWMVILSRRGTLAGVRRIGQSFFWLAILLVIGAGVFLTGVTWGLPSRAADRYLFGERTPWTGAEIMALIARSDADNASATAADVDLNPLVDRDQPIHLNATDSHRAEIALRYRLYSYQPDEMNTFMALASMDPSAGDLDPKMYKYGGLWVYPVAALLQAGSLAGVVTLRGDLAYYLDHPDAFARFYIVARLYAVAWALVGVVAVWMIARRLSNHPIAPILAGALCIFMPIVVIQAHEAKPHLPGTVLMLLAILAAYRYTHDSRWRWAILSGALCGAAVGMVLSAWPIAVVLPMMILLADQAKRQAKHLPAAGAAAVAVFVITNPYLLINLFVNRPLLRSHFQNSADFYGLGDPVTSLAVAGRLILDGASPIVVIAGLMVIMTWLIRRRSVETGSSTRRMVWLLLIPAGIVAAQFVAVAAGQPADFARFALLVDIALAIGASCGIAAISARPWRVTAMIVVVGVTAIHGLLCLAAFIDDTNPPTTRLAAAHQIHQNPGGGVLHVYAEPAPFSLPPIDLWRWQLMLQPTNASFAQFQGGRKDAAVMLRLNDTPAPPYWIDYSPYTWRMTGSRLIGYAARTGHAAKPAEWITPSP